MSAESFSQERPRARRLMRGTDFGATLIYYPPGLEQRAHRHDGAQVSFLLAGCLSEDCEGRQFQPMGKHASIMPSGQALAVRFGREGALMLAIECLAPDETLSAERSWHRMGEEAIRRVAMIGAGAPASADIAAELVAGIGEGAAPFAGRLENAPMWLRCAVMHIADDPEVGVGDLAREAGLHRVYFSRAFQRWTGISPTEFRLLRKSAAAMRRTVEGRATLAEAAADAGFADQAHWSRTCRALAGIPPGTVRRLLAA